MWPCGPHVQASQPAAFWDEVSMASTQVTQGQLCLARGGRSRRSPPLERVSVPPEGGRTVCCRRCAKPTKFCRHLASSTTNGDDPLGGWTLPCSSPTSSREDPRARSRGLKASSTEANPNLNAFFKASPAGLSLWPARADHRPSRRHVGPRDVPNHARRLVVRLEPSGKSLPETKNRSRKRRGWPRRVLALFRSLG